MIRLAENIESEDSRKVPFETKHKKVFVEVASNRLIDVAIVDADQMDAFDKSKTGEVEGINWIESTRAWEDEVEFPSDSKKRYLLFWNCNEEEDAIVAYKVTAIA